MESEPAHSNNPVQYYNSNRISVYLGFLGLQTILEKAFLSPRTYHTRLALMRHIDTMELVPQAEEATSFPLVCYQGLLPRYISHSLSCRALLRNTWIAHLTSLLE